MRNVDFRTLRSTADGSIASNRSIAIMRNGVAILTIASKKGMDLGQWAADRAGESFRQVHDKPLPEGAAASGAYHAETYIVAPAQRDARLDAASAQLRSHDWRAKNLPSDHQRLVRHSALLQAYTRASATSSVSWQFLGYPSRDCRAGPRPRGKARRSARGLNQQGRSGNRAGLEALNSSRAAAAGLFSFLAPLAWCGSERNTSGGA